MSAERPLRHKQLYLQGGDVVFRVDNLLFRLHSYFFTRESAHFRDLLLHTSSFGDEVKSSSDDCPIILENCTPSEFTTFCWVFYNPRYSLYEATVEQWATILRLAQMWEFREVIQLAFRELDKIEVEPVMRIHLYQKNSIDSERLEHAFEALATRPDPLTEEEGQLLGIKTFARIVHARELARLGGSTITPNPLRVSTVDLRAILARVGLSPLRTQTNGINTGVHAATGPQSAPLLAQPAHRQFGDHRGGSLTVPATPLETIPETPSSTSSDSPPSYDRSTNGRHLTGNTVGKLAPSWSVKVNTSKRG
ncbi:hypothetical protein K488DRAFT_90693 [Vararia minispora EC-137]|uniref:Uncharacterized protein n=1 Tax=Vararia minispora EC-137 TaxID=1314806 RepID=A0ACB8Q732_9AGAM|nr:hypothetical protein K488DRAFT_90693 [Vararia minispora EC-137]